MKRNLLLTVIAFFGIYNALAQTNGTTVITLTPEEYNALLQKAQNPTCPAAEAAAEEEERRKAKRGLTLRIGGGLNYMYGVDAARNENFESDFVDWYALGMLGYTANENQTGKGTFIGAFVTVGNTTERGITKFLEDSNTGRTADAEIADNRFYQAELGIVFFETLRLSTGTGYQSYTLDNDEKRLFYYSTTGGLQFGGRFIKLTADINFLYGRQLEATILRPTVGLLLQL